MCLAVASTTSSCVCAAATARSPPTRTCSLWACRCGRCRRGDEKGRLCARVDTPPKFPGSSVGNRAPGGRYKYELFSFFKPRRGINWCAQGGGARNFRAVSTSRWPPAQRQTPPPPRAPPSSLPFCRARPSSRAAPTTPRRSGVAAQRRECEPALPRSNSAKADRPINPLQPGPPSRQGVRAGLLRPLPRSGIISGAIPEARGTKLAESLNCGTRGGLRPCV